MPRSVQSLDSRLAVSVVRLMMGAILLVAGIEKWAGLGGAVGFFTQIGIPAPQVMAPVIASGEVIGGALLLLGLLARPAALWFVAEFLVTSFFVRLPHQGWDAARLDLLLLAGSLALVLAGAGAFALDNRRAEPAPRHQPVRVLIP